MSIVPIITSILQNTKQNRGFSMVITLCAITTLSIALHSFLSHVIDMSNLPVMSYLPKSFSQILKHHSTGSPNMAIQMEMAFSTTVSIPTEHLAVLQHKVGWTAANLFS